MSWAALASSIWSFTEAMSVVIEAAFTSVKTEVIPGMVARVSRTITVGSQL
jgi:hypothetical protein